MAAIDDYYSDSGEIEVDKAADELSEAAPAVVLRHASMALGTWLSILNSNAHFQSPCRGNT